jgi:hypothetical protein
MSTEPPRIALDDPAYSEAVDLITAASVTAIEMAGGDPQPTVRALAFVLSMYLDADRGLVTNKAIRERGEEIGKVVGSQIRWLREQRTSPEEPMLHVIVREIAERSQPASLN